MSSSLIDFMSFLCSRPVTNIQISCNLRIYWFTQWISKNQYILLGIKDFKNYEKEDIVFFEKRLDKEIPYFWGKSPSWLICLYINTPGYDLLYKHEYCQLEALHVPSVTFEFEEHSMRFIGSVLKDEHGSNLLVHRLDLLGDWLETLSVPIRSMPVIVSGPSTKNSKFINLPYIFDSLPETNSFTHTRIFVYDADCFETHFQVLFLLLHVSLQENIAVYDLFDCTRFLGDAGIDCSKFTKVEILQRFKSYFDEKVEVLFFKEQNTTKSLVPFRAANVYLERQLVWKELEPLVNTSKKNILGCVALSTTSREVRSGIVNNFVGMIASSLYEKSYPLDFLIFVNNSEFDSPPDLTELSSHFRSIQIINLDILPDLDVYLRGGSAQPTTMPPLGSTSGPNLQFLQIMNYCEKYDTTLLLETDCTFQPNWLDKCIGYVCNVGHFLLSGSEYDGSFIEYDKILLNHKNGVAFYKTGSPIFQRFLSYLRQFMERYVRYTHFDLSFDVAIYLCVEAYIKYIRDDSPHTALFWRFLKRNIVSNTLILNASAYEDKGIPIEYFAKLYDYAILHKKQ